MQDTYFQLSTDYLSTSMSRLIIYIYLLLKYFSLFFNLNLCLLNQSPIRARERGQWLKVCSLAKALSYSTHVGCLQQQLQGQFHAPLVWVWLLHSQATNPHRHIHTIKVITIKYNIKALSILLHNFIEKSIFLYPQSSHHLLDLTIRSP